MILKLAKEGLTPSRIGVMLRDEHGIPLTKRVVGKSVGEVLAEAKMLPKMPEDLENLLDKARRVQKHLESHKSDGKNVRSLELIEAKIYRLSKYYKRIGILPSDFKYTNVVAQLS